MKILYYCQHVLGLGHFFRTLEICRALSNHSIVLATGGSPVKTPLPANVREERLPELMMDADFTRIHTADRSLNIEEVKIMRRQRLFDIYRRLKPDLLIVELYPFGRKAFRFELDPLLEAIKTGDLPAAKIACSLRDILVEKKDSKTYENRVIDRLARFFDLLLVHSDPAWLKLEATFGRTQDIDIPIIYTGFVAPKPDPSTRRQLRRSLGVKPKERLVVASVGGGKVGGPLLTAVAAATRLVKSVPDCRFQLFTGPYLDSTTFQNLSKIGSDGLTVERFTPNFLSYLKAADLSISMAGYNTVMNILATCVPALLQPFSQNREQQMRAELMHRKGAIEILSAADLKPQKLARRITAALEWKRPQTFNIDLEGAAKSADFLESCPPSKEKHSALHTHQDLEQAACRY